MRSTPVVWPGPRRSRIVPGLTARVATPEDAIISKLLWLRQRATERSAEDIRGIVRLNADRLDFPYLDSMVSHLGLAHYWSPLRPLE